MFFFIFNLQRIDLYAVQELLVILQPCFQRWSADDCRQWLRAIHDSQNTIDATIFAAVENQGLSQACKKIRYLLLTIYVSMYYVVRTFKILMNK